MVFAEAQARGPEGDQEDVEMMKHEAGQVT